MCDASNLALRAILGQGVGKHSHVIAYASRTLDSAQVNYTTIEKELLAIVFALDNFHSYLLGSKIIIFSDHAALKFLNKSGAENLVADHLSRIERRIDPLPIRDDFPDEQLMQLDSINPWFANIVNYLVTSILPPEASGSYKDKIKSDAKYYVWDDPYLWKFCSDQSGHSQVLNSGFYWPTIFKDAHHFVTTCEQCQRARVAITHKHEIPQHLILFCEVFDVWGIDFMSPFSISYVTLIFCLLLIMFQDGWRLRPPKLMMLKSGCILLDLIFFASLVCLKLSLVTKGVMSAIRPCPLCLRSMGWCTGWLLLITPKPMGRPKCVIERSSKFCKRMAYRTPLRMSPYWVVFGKECHLPVEIEHQLEELLLEAYENSKVYKEKVKGFHDNMILRKEFKVGQKVLLFNSRLKLIVGKICSKWDGPFVITNVFLYGAVEIRNEAIDKPLKSMGTNSIKVK
ncbi:putative mitochondrial protein, partial [Mucuna pruriens]